MFGYVRARWDTIPGAVAENYKAVYCGLCQTIGKRYGQFARLFLNYDFTFLAMLLMRSDDALCVNCRVCLRHPFHGTLWPTRAFLKGQARVFSLCFSQERTERPEESILTLTPRWQGCFRSCKHWKRRGAPLLTVPPTVLRGSFAPPRP